MTRRNRNRRSQNQSPVTVPMSVPETSKEPIQLASPAKPPGQVKPTAWNRFKTHAWRITGFYFWLRLALWIAGEDDWLTSLGQHSSQWSISTLASFGYAPTGATHLPLVAKVGWILIITEFNVWQLVGLFFYLFTFPILMLIVIFLNETFQTTRAIAASKGEKPHGLSSPRQSWPLFTIAAFGLLAWYLLYGDAATFRTIIPGVLFSFVLFLLLAYRAFQTAKPSSLADAAILNALETRAVSSVAGMANTLAANLKKPRSELLAALKINSWQKWYLMRTAAFLRGKRGRIESISVLYSNLLSRLYCSAQAPSYFGRW